jgi:hypothetical protein
MDEVCTTCFSNQQFQFEVQFEVQFELANTNDCSMENFIIGFPGHEKGHRASALQVLGQEKYDFFFDPWLEYFFTKADA